MKKIMVAAAVLLSAAGCTAQPSPEPAPAPPPVQPSASAKPGEILAKLYKKGFTEDEVESFGLSYVGPVTSRSKTPQYPFNLSGACEVETPADANIAHMVGADLRTVPTPTNFRGGGEHRIAYYEGSTGAEAVAEFREELLSCQAYTPEGTYALEITIQDPLELPPIEGIDARWAFCEQTVPHPSIAHYACTLMLAKGNVATSVRLERGWDEGDKVRELMLKVAPKLGEALGRE